MKLRHLLRLTWARGFYVGACWGHALARAGAPIRKPDTCTWLWFWHHLERPRTLASHPEGTD